MNATFRIACMLCAFAQVASCAPGGDCSRSGRLMLAERGRETGYTIVLPNAPTKSQVFAAVELQKYVGEMTGVMLPIATNATPRRGIFLGNGAPELGNDGFRLVAKPPHLRIEGNGVHGTLFGVYDFLERYCGCEWLAPNCEVVPTCEKIEVPATLDDMQTPAFTLRDQNWTDHLRNPVFSAKLKLNGFRIEYPEELGGRDHVKDTTTGGATFDKLCPPSKYFKDHPEWFSFVDGKRQANGSQRCLTNNGFLDFLVSQMKERVRKNYPRCKYYSIYPNDNPYNYCRCPECKALDEREESHSATLMHMANYVAERVCRDYPDVNIVTFAYAYTLKPPKAMKLHPNVMICCCTEPCDFSKPIRTSRFHKNKEFVEYLEKWKTLAGKLYIWDYSANFKHMFLPFECCHVLPDNMRLFKESGAFGAFEEGDHYAVKCVDEALKTWLIGHLLWNPEQSLEPLLDRFFKGYYGAAAEVARGYYDALVEIEIKRDETKAPLVMWGWGLLDPYLPSTEFFDGWSARWTAALDLVKEDPIRHDNVYWARHNVDLARLVLSRWSEKYSLRSGSFSDDPKAAELQTTARRIIDDFDRVKGLNGFTDRRRFVRDRINTVLARKIGDHSSVRSVRVPAIDMRRDDLLNTSLVPDEASVCGEALRIDAAARDRRYPCIAFREYSVSHDPGCGIRLRVHARVERTGVKEGTAFAVGTNAMNGREKRDIENFQVPISSVKGDGYAWYSIDGVWRPAGGETIWIGNGERVDGVNPCIKAVYIDQIELCLK